MGTALEVSALLFEVPTGIVADTVSRRLSGIIGCLFIGAGFILWGTVPLFVPILIGQILSGLGATYPIGRRRGLDRGRAQGPGRGPDLPARLAAGYFAAVLGIGSSARYLGSLFGLAVPMAAGGIGFLVIAASLVAFMPEDHFTPEPRGRSQPGADHERHPDGRGPDRPRPPGAAHHPADHVHHRLRRVRNDRLWELHILDNFAFPTFVELPPIAWFGLISVTALLASIGVAEVARRRVDSPTATWPPPVPCWA